MLHPIDAHVRRNIRRPRITETVCQSCAATFLIAVLQVSVRAPQTSVGECVCVFVYFISRNREASAGCAVEYCWIEMSALHKQGLRLVLMRLFCVQRCDGHDFMSFIPASKPIYRELLIFLNRTRLHTIY